MADEKLIFPIGFDLEEGVAQVEKDWGKMQKRLQDTFKSQTIQVDADISKAVLDKLYAKFEGLIKTMESKAPQIKLKIPDTVDFEQEINRLKVQLKSINLGELTDAESKDLYLYIRQLEALAKALKEVNKQEQLRQANRPEVIALRQAQAEEKRTRAIANSALAEQRRAKIATETARQNEINNRSAQRGAVIAEQKRAATARAEQAELRLTQAKQRSTAATHEQNAAYKTQGGYLSRLFQRMVAYASVAQVMSFLRNIREVTAEFELQRVALGALIQDAYKANVIFEQIKVSAVKSPYEVKELVDYTKKLAAYGVEADDLMDTMNRLTDISAGLGTDMDRIILAYGQIQAAGVLKGTELRQLTELGIPMVDLLAEYYSTLRNEVVTTSEVFDMISKKEIPFEAVKDILEDLTSEGGRFFEMQAIQAETLAGQWSNMKDTLSIMFDEMGRSEEVRGLLEGFIDQVKYLALNWREVWQTLKLVGGTYVMLKSLTLAQNLYNASLTTTTKGLRRYLLLTMDIPQWWKKINIATLKNIVVNIKSAFTWKSLAIGIKTATAALKQFVKTLVLATLSNPVGWITGIATVIGLIKLKTAEGVDAMDAFRERQREMVKESVKNTTILVSNFKRLANEVINSTDGSEQQAQALRRLKQQYGEIFPEWKLTVDYLRNIAEEGNNAADSFDSMASSIRSFAAEDMRQTLIENYQTQLQEQLADVFAQLTDETGRNYADVIGMILQDFDKYATFDELWDRVEEAYKGGRTAWQVIADDPKSYDYNLLYTLAEAYYNINDSVERMMGSFDKLDPRLADVNKQMKELGETLTNIEKETGGDTAENVATTIDKKRKEAIDAATRKLLESEGISVVGNVTLDWTIANLDKIKAKAKRQGGEISDAFYEGIKQLRAFSGDYDDLWREDLANMVEYLDDGKRKVQAYASDQIAGFGTLDNALVSVAERYKELGDEVARLKKTSDALKLKPIDEQDTKEIENYRKEISKIETIMRFLYKFLEKYGGLDLLKDEKKEQKVNPQIKQLEDELAMVEKIYKKYEEYRKTKGDAEARALVEEYFKGVDLKWLDRAFSTTELKAQAQEALRIMKTFWGDTKKAEQNIQFKIGDIDYNETKRELEQKMKKLSDDLSRTKTAKEFFDRMLGMTGDKQLSASLTVSIYGGVSSDDLGETLAKDMAKKFEAQVQEYFGDIDISSAINKTTGEIDPIKLEKLLTDENIKAIGEDNVNKIRKIIADLISANDKYWEELMKDLEKARTYGDKLVKVYETTQERIAQVNAREDLDVDAKKQLIDQINELQGKEMQKLQYEAFKDSPMYVAMFEKLDTTSTTMLRNMRNHIVKLKSEWKNLDPTQLKELQSRINEIDKQLATRNPFKSIVDGIKEFNALQKSGSRKDAEEALAYAAERRLHAEHRYQQAVAEGKSDEEIARIASWLDKCVDAEDEAAKKMSEWDDATQKVVQGINELQQIVQIVQTTTTAVNDIVEAFGGWGDVADEEFWNTILDGINGLMSGVQSIGTGIILSMINPLAGIPSIISGIGSIFSSIGNLIYAGRIKRANKEIERQQELLDDLSYSYDRLQKESEKAFGTEYIQNYNRQLANLEAQVDAYEKQLDAERSKGKKADEEKIAEYKNQIQDTKDAIEDMYGSLSEYFLGTDLTSAARDFASAWIDAYKEFGSTTDAMKEKFQEMIQNMIVNSLAAKIMEKALEPVFTMIDKMNEGDFYNPSFWQDLMAKGDKAITDGSVGLENVFGWLESIGVQTRNLGSGLTGISRDIATASEESILGLAAGINTQNFYISQVPTKLDTIIGLLRGGSTVVDSGVNVQDLITIQNQFLSHLPTIAQNTAETVARCERAAVACESMASKLGSVIKPKGTTSTHSVNVTIGS